jgi:hypothetical protein
MCAQNEEFECVQQGESRTLHMEGSQQPSSGYDQKNISGHTLPSKSQSDDKATAQSSGREVVQVTSETPQQYDKSDIKLFSPGQLIVGNQLPTLDAGDNDQWAIEVTCFVSKATTKLVDKIGGWLTSDMDQTLLLMLLQDHTSDVVGVCHDYQALVQADKTVDKLASLGKTSKVLEANDTRPDTKQAFTMKLEKRPQVQKLVVKLEHTDVSGHKTQLGQFLLKSESRTAIIDGAEYQITKVPANQLPFGAIMFLRGAMQVIDWYSSQNFCFLRFGSRTCLPR